LVYLGHLYDGMLGLFNDKSLTMVSVPSDVEYLIPIVTMDQ
jgi:hypothetical protein